MIFLAGATAFKKLIYIKALFFLIYNKAQLIAQPFCILTAVKGVHNTALGGNMKGTSEYTVRKAQIIFGNDFKNYNFIIIKAVKTKAEYLL